MNPQLKQTLKVTTIAGAAIIGVGAVAQLFTQPFVAKKAVMPIVTVLVALSALSYAMGEKGGEIELLEKKEVK